MAAGTTTGTGAAPTGQGGDFVRDQDKIMLVLAYLGVLALIPLITARDSDYVQWHAKQGLALFLCWLAYTAAGVLIGVMPFPGLLVALAGLGHIGFFGLAIVAIIKAFEPCRWPIPVVSAIAQKL